MKQLQLFYPLKPSVVNQPFGTNGQWYRDNGIDIIGHNGIDYRATHGQPVYATHDGEVVYAGMDSKEGYGIVLMTNEEFEYKDGEAHFNTKYWHLLPNFVVTFGDKVRAGDLLGYCDNSGFSTSDHLHFALKPVLKLVAGWNNLEKDNGYMGGIDPTSYFNGSYAEDVKQILSISKLLIKALERLISLLVRY